MSDNNEILMQVHKEIGELSATVRPMVKDIREIRLQTTATNGRVSKAEDSILIINEKLADFQKRLETPNWAKITWQKIVLFLGATGTILAYVIEKI